MFAFHSLRIRHVRCEIKLQKIMCVLIALNRFLFALSLPFSHSLSCRQRSGSRLLTSHREFFQRRILKLHARKRLMQHAWIACDRQSRGAEKKEQKFRTIASSRGFIYSVMISSFPVWKWSMASENAIGGIPMVVYRRRSKWRVVKTSAKVKLQYQFSYVSKLMDIGFGYETRVDSLFFSFYFLVHTIYAIKN